MSQNIWKEFQGIVRHGDAQVTGLTEAGLKRQCGVSREDTPICRVQERLFEEKLRARAMELQVPDMGDRWFFWTTSVTCGVVAFFVVFGPMFWNRVEGWWSKSKIEKGRFAQIAELFLGGKLYETAGYWSFAGVLIASAYSAGILGRSKASLFRYKIFMPVPDAFGGPLKWDYYVTSALPQADMEALAYAGGGVKARLAARAAAKYQGALSIAQARIKCKDAIVALRQALKGSKGGPAPDAAKEVDRVSAACGYVDEATELLRGVQALLAANALTAARLADIIEGRAPSATPKLKDLAQRVRASRANPYLAAGEPGSLPADPAFLDQATIALEVALPKIAEAERDMRAALENLVSLGERLQPAAVAMGYLDDPRYRDAIAEALASLPKTGKGSSAMAAVKAMSDDDVLKADAALGVASATMDYTILPSVRGGDLRIRKITNAYFWTVISVVIVWAALLLKAGGQSLFSTVAVDGTNDKMLKIWKMLMDERAKKNLVGSLVDSLNLIVRILVIVIVLTALFFQLLGMSIRWDVDERARITMLERMGDALRKMVALGGVRGSVKDPDEFSDALANLDVALAYDVLTDKNAHARMPVRISTLVVGVLVLAVTGVCLYLMVRTMQPGSDVRRMHILQKETIEKATMSGGALTPEELAFGDTRDREVLFTKDGYVPLAVRGPIVLAGIVSLVYYLVLMIMTEHRTRDLYVAQRSLENKLTTS